MAQFSYLTPEQEQALMISSQVVDMVAVLIAEYRQRLIDKFPSNNEDLVNELVVKFSEKIWSFCLNVKPQIGGGNGGPIKYESA